MLCLPRAFELLTTFSDDTLDVERFAQVRSYRCSCRRANARVGGQNLLTSSGIYQPPLSAEPSDKTAQCGQAPIVGGGCERFLAREKCLHDLNRKRSNGCLTACCK